MPGRTATLMRYVIRGPAAAIVLALSAFVTPVWPQPVTVVEFYNSAARSLFHQLAAGGY